MRIMHRSKRIKFDAIRPEDFTHKAWCVGVPCYWDDRSDGLRGRNLFWDWLLNGALLFNRLVFGVEPLPKRYVPVRLTTRLSKSAQKLLEAECRDCGAMMSVEADYDLSGAVIDTWFRCPKCGDVWQRS